MTIFRDQHVRSFYILLFFCKVLWFKLDVENKKSTRCKMDLECK